MRLQSNVIAFAVHSGLLLLLTVVETYFTHVLEKYLPNEEGEGHHEEQPLVDTGGAPQETAYDACN